VLSPGTTDEADPVRVWLVERTFSDDEQNIVILIYATPDGECALRKERALTSFSPGERDTTASVMAHPWNLETVYDPETREYYASEARRMRTEPDPDEAIWRRYRRDCRRPIHVRVGLAGAGRSTHPRRREHRNRERTARDASEASVSTWPNGERSEP
jgi:hypothetical protein